MKIIKKYLSLLLLIFSTYSFGAATHCHFEAAPQYYIRAVPHQAAMPAATLRPPEPATATLSFPTQNAELSRVSEIQFQNLQAVNETLSTQLHDLSLQQNQHSVGYALSVELSAQATKGLSVESIVQKSPELLALNNQLAAKTEFYFLKFKTEVGCYPNDSAASGLTLKQILHTTPQDLAKLSLEDQAKRIAVENNFLQQQIDITTLQTQLEGQITIYRNEIAQALHSYARKTERLSIAQLEQEIPKFKNQIQSINNAMVEIRKELTPIQARLAVVEKKIAAFGSSGYVGRLLKDIRGGMNSEHSKEYLEHEKQCLLNQQEALQLHLINNELALAKTNAQFQSAKDLLQQRTELQVQLKQVQKFYGDIANQGLAETTDQKLLYAINLSVFDAGTRQYEAHNKLTAQAQELLVKNNIAPEKFTSTTGNALQKNLFEQNCDILDQTAQLAEQYKGNQALAPYIKATTLSCSAAMDMVITGTAQEAIGSTKVACALHQTSLIAAGVVKGVGEGVVSGATSMVKVVAHPIQTIEDLKQAVHFLTLVARCDEKTIAALHQALDSFKHLPLDQQIQKITALVTSLAVPCGSVKFIKCAEMQRALSALGKTVDLAKSAEKVGTVVGTIEQGAAKAGQVISGAAGQAETGVAAAIQATQETATAQATAAKATTVAKDIAKTVREGAVIVGRTGAAAAAAEALQGQKGAASSTSSGTTASPMPPAPKFPDDPEKEKQKVVTSIATLEERAQTVLKESKELGELKARTDFLKQTTSDSHTVQSAYKDNLSVSQHEKLEAMALKLYDQIRHSNIDVRQISSKTNIPERLLQKIKNHVFHQKHRLARGIGGFDADLDIAETWLRLEKGNFVRTDIDWLLHEFAESIVMNEAGLEWRVAHNFVDKIYPWAELIKTK